MPQPAPDRIGLRNKKYDKIKKSVEGLVIAHGGNFTDKFVTGGKVKAKYERVVDGKVSRFIYTYHGSPQKNGRLYQNARQQINQHLQKLDIVERLPMLMVRSTATYDADMLAARKSDPIGLAFVAYEDAWNEEDDE